MPNVRIYKTIKQCKELGADLERLSDRPRAIGPVWYQLTVNLAKVTFSVDKRVPITDWTWKYNGYKLENTRAGSFTRITKEARNALQFDRNGAVMHLIKVLQDEEALRKDAAEMLARQLLKARRRARDVELEVEYAEYRLAEFLKQLSATSDTAGSSLQSS